MPNLKAEKRDIAGKKVAVLRAEGLVPAELYGSKTENIHLTVNSKDLEKTYREAGESSVIILDVGAEAYPVLIHDHQVDHLTGKMLSVDFYKVDMNEKISATVPLVFIGESLAVKEEGGVLVKSMDEVEVEALPAELPHELRIDISSIKNLEDSIYVRDIPITGKFEILTDPNTVVATVTAVEEEAEVAPVSVADVKTEGEVKRAEKETKKAEEE